MGGGEGSKFNDINSNEIFGYEALKMELMLSIEEWMA